MKNHRILLALLPGLLGLLAACQGAGSADGPIAGEPAFENAIEVLEKELRCTAFSHPQNPAVLLVHGTFTAGWEQYAWNYIPLLQAEGFDVCTTTYPDRGFGDMQNSAEYVVHALRRMHEVTGRKVAMVGHSQGVSVPRWAIKWWPSARAAVDDFVMLAGPNHGTIVSDPLAFAGDLANLGLPLSAESGLMPAAFHQFPPDSDFMRVSNLGDETPGDISYTSLYTLSDELVQPFAPVPTAALEFGQDNPQVTNLLLQDLCQGYVVDHAAIGLIDGVAYALTLDALRHPGPAHIERAGGAALCGLPVLPQVVVDVPGFTAGGAVIFPMEFENGAPDWHLQSEEPPLKPYAQAASS